MDTSPLGTLIEQTDPRILRSALAEESPRDIAIFVVSLPTEQGARVINELLEQQCSLVVAAITELDTMQTDDVDEVVDRLSAKIQSASEGTVLFEDGPALLAGLLAKLDVTKQESILDDLATHRPDTTEKVREKLLDFGELIHLDDDSIRLLLDNLELRTLAIALRSASDEARQAFYSRMSEEEIGVLQAEIETLAQEHVLASPQIQRVIVDTVRKFQAQGMIRFQSEGR